MRFRGERLSRCKPTIWMFDEQTIQIFVNDMQILINWKVKFETDIEITLNIYSIQMTIFIMMNGQIFQLFRLELTD